MAEGLEDQLNDFIRKNRHNLGGPVPNCVNHCDDLLAKLSSSLDDALFFTSSRLFHLAFSSWRTAVVISLSGASHQVPLLLRHAIEASLNCYLFSRDRDMKKLWWDRETDDKAKQRLRNGRNGALARAKELLANENNGLKKRLTDSLDHMIDFGAHPNVFQLVNATEYAVDDKSETYFTAFLGDDQSRVNAFIQCTGVALQLSEIFEIIWPAQFSKVGGKAVRAEAFGQTRLFIQAHQKTKLFSRI